MIGQVYTYNVTFSESMVNVLIRLVIAVILSNCYNSIATAIIGSLVDWLVLLYSGYLFSVLIVLVFVTLFDVVSATLSMSLLEY